MLLRRIRHTDVHPFLSRHRFYSFSDSTFKTPNYFSEPSIVKIISTVFLLSPPSPSAASSRLVPLGFLLTPSAASDVILHCIRDPRRLLSFFEITRTNFKVTHLVASYRHVVRVLCEHGLRTDAAKVFDEMCDDGHMPDGSVLGILVNAYARARELDIAMRLLGKAGEWGCHVEPYFYNDVISRLIAMNRVDDGIRFFQDQLKSSSFAPDTWSFNIVIKGLCRLGKMDGALQLFNDMGRFWCVPDSVTYGTLVNGFCKTDQVDKGRELLSRIQINSDTLHRPSVVTYTSLISGYCRIGKMHDAAIVFNEMIDSGVEPNKVTFNVLIDGYGKAGDTTLATMFYEKMLLSGCTPDVVTLTSLVDGYCRNGQVDDALDIWIAMKEKNIWPNAYTFAIVINALCKQNRLSEARHLLTELGGRVDITARPFMYNPVIDRFCKAGNLDEANLVLFEMESNGCLPDKITYTVLIIGHCMKGRMSEALMLFSKMIMHGCNPDSVTINSLTSCLLKAGMPKEAGRIVAAVSGWKAERATISTGKISSMHRSSEVSVAA